MSPIHTLSSSSSSSFSPARLPTDCQPQRAYIIHTSPADQTLLALSIILHESLLAPQFFKLLLSILLGGSADVGVGKGSLRNVTVSKDRWKSGLVRWKGIENG